MTEQEYKLLAKRTNQRLVTAINIGTYNIEGQRIQRELFKLGFTRFPERMSRVPASKLADTIRVLQDYDRMGRAPKKPKKRDDRHATHMSACIWRRSVK